MSSSYTLLPGEKTINLKNISTNELLTRETSTQENVIDTKEPAKRPTLSDEDSEASETLEKSPTEESATTWVEMCSDKGFKISGIGGAMTSTFAYCLGYGLTDKAWAASLMGLIPGAASLGMINVASDPYQKKIFTSFSLAAATTALGDTIGDAFDLESYPLVVPIVVFNIVTLGYVAAPVIHLAATKVNEKLAHLSINRFNLWNSSKAMNNKNSNNESLEMMPLNAVQVEEGNEERRSYSSLRQGR